MMFKTVVSFFTLFSVASAHLPGQDVYDMVIDQIAENEELNLSLKSVFAPAAGTVQALRQADCSLLKDSTRSLVIIFQALLKKGSDNFIKQMNLDPQMSMMVQMGQSFALSQFESNVDHMIEHNACLLAIRDHQEL